MTLARRAGLGLFVLLCALAGAWVAALLFLPDAPPSTSLPKIAPPAERLPASSAPARPIAPSAAWNGTVLALPIAGVTREAIRDSWGDPRDNGLRPHHGTDIMAPQNTPILAAAPGMVEKLWTSGAGGITLYIRSPARDWTYYYAHLAGYAPGLHEGQVVNAGDPLGYVGDTGNAGAGNYHLHFGLTRTAPDQHWYQGEDVDPYPYLAGKPAPR